MRKELQVETPKNGLDRRGFLATGALAALGGTLLGAGDAAAATVDIDAGSAQPVIDHVFPLRGAEGDTITLVGRGFDADPARNRIVLGEGRARVEIVAAAPNHLVGVLGAVTSPGPAAVEVARGEERALADCRFAGEGCTSVGVAGRRFVARSTTRGAASFQLLGRSASSASGRVEVDLAAGPFRAVSEAAVEVLAPGLSQRFDLRMPAAPASPAAFAAHLARHLGQLEDELGLVVEVKGTRLGFDHRGGMLAAPGQGWVRLDLRLTAVARRGPWFSSWSGRVG